MNITQKDLIWRVDLEALGNEEYGCPFHMFYVNRFYRGGGEMYECED